MSSSFEKERERLVRLARKHPRPCLVCDSDDVVGVGSWIPNQRFILAAGGNSRRIPVFAFWICETHFEVTEANEKLIQQAILRSKRTGETYEV